MIGGAVNPFDHLLHENGIRDDYCMDNELAEASFSGTAEVMEKLAPSIVQRIVNSDANRFTEEEFKCERRAVLNEVNQLDINVMRQTIQRGLREVYGILGPEGLMENIRAYSYEDFKKDHGRIVAHPSRIVYVGTAPVVGNRDCAIMGIASHMLTGDDDAVLLERLRTKEGLVCSCTGSVDLLRNAGVLVYRIPTPVKNTEKVLRCMAEILENPEQHLAKELFERTKLYFSALLKMGNILRYNNCQDLVRKGMIDFDDDFGNIEYPEFIETTKKYMGSGKFRAFVG